MWKSSAVATRVSFALFASLLGVASEAQAWHFSNENAYQVDLNTANVIAQKSGATAQIQGKLTGLKAANGSAITGKDLNKLLRDDQLEIRAYFPDFTQEVTSDLKLSTNSQNIGIAYQTPILQSSALNTMIVQIKHASPETEELQRVDAKIDFKILSLRAWIDNLVRSHGDGKTIQGLKDLLSQWIIYDQQVEAQIKASYQIVAEMRLPLQVDNQVAGSSYKSYIANHFQFSVTYDLGSAIQGDTALATGAIVWAACDAHHMPAKDTQYTATFFWNGKVVQKLSPQQVDSGTPLQFAYSTGKLSPSIVNTFSESLDSKVTVSKNVTKQSNLGLLALIDPVAADSVAPSWIGVVTPDASHADVQSLQPVSATLQDNFGRIDLSSIKAVLTGTEVSGKAVNVDITQALTIVPAASGSGYTVSGNLNPLNEGTYTLTLTGQDLAGNAVQPYVYQGRIDRTPPQIVLGLKDGVMTHQGLLNIPVTILDLSPTSTKVTANGKQILVSGDLSFNAQVGLQEGLNLIQFDSIDAAGNVTSKTLSNIILDTTPPVLSSLVPADQSVISQNTVSVSGVSNEALSSISLNGQLLSLSSDRRSFTGSLAFQTSGSVVLNWVATDLSGLTTSVNSAVHVSLPIANLPPDPATVAPPSNPTNPSTVAANTQFLYSGPNPIQSGVPPGTISPQRAGLIRGRVMGSNNEPIAGVKVTVLNRPEFGQTTSRVDGYYDLAVNGGELFTLNFSKDGFSTLQRQVKVDWQTYVNAPTVVLNAYDAAVSTVNLSSAGTLQVAQSSISRDQDGQRQTSIVFPAGTQALAHLPNGSTQPLSTLSVRATELTVGSNGLSAMPGDLPPTSGYTYAADFTADEAIALGADHVEFDHPVYTYVDNYLNFPVGGTVPSAYFDRAKGMWIPTANGRVIEIVGVNSGKAQIDLDGSGSPADSSSLSTLGFSDSELEKLATLYPPGKSFWRVPISHFSVYDFNWPIAVGPSSAPPSSSGPTSSNPSDPGPNVQCGSIIEVENQILGEQFSVTGTPFTINYRSDRVTGRQALRSIDIPLGSTLPPGVKEIELKVNVAGKEFTKSFPPSEGQVYTYAWDGYDVYGRPVQGSVYAKVSVGYTYDAHYEQPATDIAPYSPSNQPDFAAFGRVTGIPISGSVARSSITLWKEWTTPLGAWDARSAGLGGWTLSVHHIYDPISKILHLGDGTSRKADNLPQTIATIAHSQEIPRSLVIGPDGSAYFLDSTGEWAYIKRVDPQGNVTTFAGVGPYGFSPDGTYRLNAKLGFTFQMAFGPDQSLYFTDWMNHMIRKIDSSGNLQTVAGIGSAGYGGDDGLAKSAQLNHPWGLAFGPDGSLYFSDSGNQRIRKVTPDGYIYTVLGTGATGVSPDGTPALQATLSTPSVMAVGLDGSVYFPEVFAFRILKLDTSGRLRVVAGTGSSGPFNEGDVAATSAIPSYPMGLALGRDGTIYFDQSDANNILTIDTAGKLRSFAGQGYAGDAPDGTPARSAVLSYPTAPAIGPDGSFYFADAYNRKIRRISSPLPGYDGRDIFLASGDGSQVYHFDHTGRHLETLSALTSAMLYRFQYDQAGYLVSIQDGDSNTTNIARDGNEQPISITGPYGQTTQLVVDANGYLASLTDPGNHQRALSHRPDGLLVKMLDPNNNTFAFEYDPTGFLTKDLDPVGGFTSLARSTPGLNTVNINRTTAMGVTENSLTRSAGTDIIRTQTDGAGLTNTLTRSSDGSNTEISHEGLSTVNHFSPDPRFGFAAQFVSSQLVKYPSGLQPSYQTTKNVTLSDPNNFFSLSSLIEDTVINGKRWHKDYNALTRVENTTSPMGRVASKAFDSLGREISKQSPGLLPTQFSRDSHGRISSIIQGDRTKTYTYNTSGWVDTVTDSVARVTSMQYDSSGQVVSKTLPNGNVILFSYDSNGSVTSITPPQRPAHKFDFNPINLLASYLAPPVSGQAQNPTLYSYNLDRQLAQVQRPDGQTLIYNYDRATGKLISITSAQGVTQYTYSLATGLLSSIADPNGETVSFGYDGSLENSETWSGAISGSFSQVFDSDLRVASQSVSGGSTISFSYDNDGLLIQAGGMGITRSPETGLVSGSSLNTINETLTQNSYGELTSYQAAGSSGNLYSSTLTRDKAGRITSKTETVLGQSKIFTYTYNSAGQLSQVTHDGNVFSSYSYDANGNRLSRSTPDGTTSATINDRDQLISYGSINYQYTLNGEVQSKTDSQTGTQTTYGYDASGNLVSANVAGIGQITYQLDGVKRRIGKSVNGVLLSAYLYKDNLAPVAQLDGSGALVSQFVYGKKENVPDYMIKNGVTYALISDESGSVRVVVDSSSGNIAQRLDYDEFGNVTLDTAPGFQPFGFAGGLYDSETGLTHFGARDYDASVGRWLQKDPIGFRGGQTNLYGYVMNDPVNFVDPRGLVAGSISGNYPSGDGYTDINVTIAPPSGGPGITFGGQFYGGSVYPYAGGGVFTGSGVSLTSAPGQCPSPGLNLNASGRQGMVSGNVSYSTGSDSWSLSGGIGTPGGGASATWVFSPIGYPGN